MLHVSLRQLEYILAVGRAGSLSAAAIQLRVSQPALSVAITQVETRIGAPLFIRRKGVAITPTAFGRMFLEDAAALLKDAEQLERPGSLSKRRQARVTIGVLEELAPAWLAPILVMLTAAYPQTEVRALAVSFEALTSALLSGQIDIGLTYDLGLDARQRTRKAKHDHPCGHRRSPADLVGPGSVHSPHPRSVPGDWPEPLSQAQGGVNRTAAQSVCEW
jgi:DNA-binding transcriptional LysR family regulator